MAVSVAAVAAKAAAAAVSSKQGRTAVATVVTAVLLPFMLAVVVVLSLLDGTTNHNVAAVKQAFFGGTLTGQIPQEYRGYMEDIQKTIDLQKAMHHLDQKEMQDEENLKIIKSPMVGTFYASSAPNKPPFVKLGDKVKKGQVVCIVEAMKLMNEIESEFDGEVVEICVNNEDIVEYGKPLIKLK